MNRQPLVSRCRGHWPQIFRAVAPHPVMLEAIERAQKYPNSVSRQKTYCPVHTGKSGKAFRVLPNFTLNGYCVCNSCNEGKPMSGYEALMWLTGEDVKPIGQKLGAYLDNLEGPRLRDSGIIVPPEPVVAVAPAAPEQAQKPEDGTPADELLEFLAEAFPFDHPQSEPARCYYRRRGFTSYPVSPVLKCHPGLRYWVPSERREQLFPTLFAVFQTLDGEFAGLHGTVITQDGHKAPVNEPKVTAKVRGRTLSGAAVRMFEPGPILGTIEGIEKAWAVHLGTGMPMWPGTNAPLMGSMEIPPEVQLTVIWADFDEFKVNHGKLFEPGRVAAERLRARLQAQHRAYRLVYPTILNQRGKDWEDVWHTLGRDGFPTIAGRLWSLPTVRSVMERWRRPSR